MNKVSHDSETPAQGKQVISACAFVHADFAGETKIFLAKRADTKKFLPGVYELPGGHIDFGEDILDGLKREIKEELNMSVTVGDPFYAATYINHIKGSHSIQVTYFAQFAEPIENIKIQPEDHSTYGWFSEEEVKAMRKQIVAEIYEGHVHGDDPEYLTMLRGFELLNSGKVKF